MNPISYIICGLIILVPSGIYLISRMQTGFNGMYKNGFGSTEVFYIPSMAVPVILGVILVGKGVDKLTKK